MSRHLLVSSILATPKQRALVRRGMAACLSIPFLASSTVNCKSVTHLAPSPLSQILEHTTHEVSLSCRRCIFLPPPHFIPKEGGSEVLARGLAFGRHKLSTLHRDPFLTSAKRPNARDEKSVLLFGPRMLHLRYSIQLAQFSILNVFSDEFRTNNTHS